jgi:hypothetical protein
MKPVRNRIYSWFTTKVPRNESKIRTGSIIGVVILLIMVLYNSY